MPVTSPLMSARKTGTPASESWPASICRVIVLPVPVAPATRPCRFNIDSGTLTRAVGSGTPPDSSGPRVSAGPWNA